MPNVRNLPKWLALLASLAIAHAVLPAVGCGGSGPVTPPPPPEPAKPGDTTLRALSISSGVMTPAFSSTVANYGATLLAEPAGFTVTASAGDPAAVLTLAVQGQPARAMAQGQPTAVALNEGVTSIRIIVEAQNGDASATMLTIDKPRPNTRVWVLNSTLGGSHVEDTVITLKDAGGSVIQGDIALPPEKNGTVLLALDPSQKYGIYASGKGSAEACFVDFDRSREDTVALYALPGWLAAYTKAAPEVVVEFSSSNNADSVWRMVPKGENFVTDTRDNLLCVRVTALARNPIIAVGSNDGISMSLDRAVDHLGRHYYNQSTTCTPVMLNGVQLYQLVYTATISRLAEGNPASSHFLSIAATDMAWNRTERRIYLKVTDMAPDQTGDTDLSSVVPLLRAVQTQTFGLPYHFSSITPVEGYGSEYTALLAWRAGDSYSGSRIRRGYEVWRSEDGVGWDKVLTQPEAGATSMPQTAELIVQDRAPGVREDVTYHYKVRMFNGNPLNGGYSQFSNVMPIKFAPAFTTKLLSPGHNEVVRKLWPTMRFKVTNPDVLKNEDALSAAADSFFGFCIGLRDVTGQGDHLWDVPFRMFYNHLDEEGSPLFAFYADYDWYVAECQDGDDGPWVPWVWAEDDGAIAIDTDNRMFDYAAWQQTYDNDDEYYYLRPGRVYEWSIFGQWSGIVDVHIPFSGSGDNPSFGAFAYKEFPVPAGTPTGANGGTPSLESFSFGSRYEYGYGSPNGWFTLITADDAE